MKLSIITINYNNRIGLERTIKSVAGQSEKPFEYIVVDGGSNDGGVDVIRNNIQYVTKWVSEPDGGLYEAINKGTRMATGDYCLYLNSGDTLYSEDVISRINSLDYTEDFMEGIANTINGLSRVPPKYSLKTILYNRNPLHQACLIKRSMVIERPYDESYRIAGDLAFNVNNLVLHACSFRPLDFVICNYEPGGRSETIEHQNEIERAFSNIPIRIMEDYEEIRWLYQFPIKQLHPFMHVIAQSVFVYSLKLLVKKMLGKAITPKDYQELEIRKKKLI